MAARQFESIDLAPYIDHSLLLPTATPDQVEHWCMETERYGFAAVCVYPVHVRQAADLLHGRKPRVCTVIGFPCGANTSQTKQYEAQEAVENGATELDVVINLGWLKSGQTDRLHREMATLVEATGQTIKAILETTLLSDAEKKLAAEICMDAGVTFLKTSTGWNGGPPLPMSNCSPMSAGGECASRRPEVFVPLSRRLRSLKPGPLVWGLPEGQSFCACRQRWARGRNNTGGSNNIF
jgi:deoxyribose-phosphate aldolase